MLLMLRLRKAQSRSGSPMFSCGLLRNKYWSGLLNRRWRWQQYHILVDGRQVADQQAGVVHTCDAYTQQRSVHSFQYVT